MGLNSVDRGSKATRHLQYPAAAFKSPAKDSNRRGLNCASGRPRRLVRPRAPPRHAPLGAGRPLTLVGKQAAVVAPEEPTSADQKQRRYERFCHKPLIPVEAVHLGDLMRYEYDQAYALVPSGFSRVAGRTDTTPTRRCSSSRWTLPPLSRFQGLPRLLGSTNPCASAAHMEPFPFRLQSSHLNICYYHQDLHRRPPRPGSRPRFFHGQPPRPPTHRGLAVAPTGRASLGTVNPLSVHPASPVLLTKNGPLELSIRGTAQRQPHRPYLFKNSHAGLQLSRGKLRGNQLLDGSISLSPLYPSQTNDLHRQDRHGLHQSFSLLRPPRHSSPSFGPGSPLGDPANQLPLRLYGFGRPLTRTHVDSWSVFQDGSNGEPAGRRQERQGATRARPRGRYTTLLGSQRDDDPLAGSSAWLVASRTRCRSTPRNRRGRTARRPRDNDRCAHRRPHPLPSRQFQALLTLFSKSFSSFLKRSDRVRHNGLSPSLAPHSMGLAPSVAEDASADYTNGRKAADSHTGLFPFAATRGILRCSHLTWGRIRARPPVTEATAGRGPSSEPGASTRLRATQGQGGRSHHCRGRAPLGQSVFQPTSPGGARTTTCCSPDDSAPDRRRGAAGHGGGENTPGGRPGRCTLDLVASGATYALKDSMVRGILQFTPSIAISPRSSSMREPRYPLSSRLGYRVRGRPRRPLLFRLAQIAESGCSWCSPPDRRWVADAEPAGRRVANARRGIRRALRLPPPPPLGIVVQLARLVALLRGIDNDPSAGSPTETFVTTSPSSK
ncbi:hypothetical protein H6P81_021250 [Aristolochia fimbriata]|uniref:Uncharacterized protein n=1 Tax=Aristolochia fimbriata TaxID=158543 RepID=A0AAV7DQI2_ARIFI|nr:hypothetical protein H6P81_021250 [Aristolochia fimbriata]